MTGTPLLLFGLLAIFCSGTIVIVALTQRETHRRQVLRSLHGLGSEVALPAPADLGFGARVVLPSIDRISTLAGRLTPSGGRERIVRQLDLAGNPSGWTVERVLAAKGLGAPIGLAIGMLSWRAGIGLGFLDVPVAAAAGFWGPDIWLKNTGMKRQEAVQRALPDVLDLLVIGVEAGLGFDAALLNAARRTSGPLAGEFHRVLQEMQLGAARGEAFRAMAERTCVDELRTFVTAVVQADRLGIPIAGVLREQAKEMRSRRQQRAEEKAAKVPVKILFPLVFCILPSLFVVIMGPGAIQIMKTLSGHH